MAGRLSCLAAPSLYSVICTADPLGTTTDRHRCLRVNVLVRDMTVTLARSSRSRSTRRSSYARSCGATCGGTSGRLAEERLGSRVRSLWPRV